jgi:SDR family mycofactocin-dependent oxidoreductase
MPAEPLSQDMNRPGRLSGKVALVTGAARGQGRSHAVRLAREGADLLILDICGPIDGLAYPTATTEDLEKTAQLVHEAGGRAISLTVDVRDARGLTEAVKRGVQELGHLDIVVANAGVIQTQKWDEIQSEDWATVVGVNLTGTWNTCQAAIPHVIASGGGSVILVSSVSGLKGLPFMSHYAASKHGVVGIMRSLSNELASQNVRVNSLHPTGVGTPMLAGMGPLAQYLDDDPTTRPLFDNALPTPLISADDVSNVVVFLASDEAKFITGHTMSVDAGATNR